MASRSAEPIPAARDAAAIIADLHALHARQQCLLAELAGAGGVEVARQGVPAARGEPISLKEAARRTGWSVRRIKRLMMVENARAPQDPIGWQPGGMKHTGWQIWYERLLRVQKAL